MRQIILAAALCAVGPRPAFALKSNIHEQLTADACRNAALPPAFCARAAREAVNVDAFEWDDLTAHAMPRDNEDRCAGANHVLQRMDELGADMRTEARTLATTVDAPDAGRLVTAFGRLLHAMQDNCGHRGMTDPQHSWLAQSNTCTGSPEDMDTADASVTCAREETERVVEAMVTMFRDVGLGSSRLVHAPGAPWVPPPASGVCTYFAKAKTWSGIDTRWDNDIMRPLMFRQWNESATRDGPARLVACNDEKRDLVSPRPEPTVDTSIGAPRCWLDFIVCPSTGAPDLPVSELAAPVEVADTIEGGCSSAGPSPFVALVLPLLLLRRRATRGRSASR